MSSTTKAIPGLAVGDTVWLAGGFEAIPARVLRAYKTMGKALVTWFDGQPRTGAIFWFNDGTEWWRTEAAALVVVREKQRARHERNRESAERELRRTLEARAAEMRRLEECEERIRAELAEIDAALAALDAEGQQ